MLTAEKNHMLTRVGPGTPMGALLRRYWQPIAGASELDDKNPIKPIRLMGEDLVLYRDLGGRYGLVDRHCPHRRADLLYGWVESTGIRCSYHGWLFDAAGRCLEQPYEDVANPNPRGKERCSTKAYPVRELAGLLWAYLGRCRHPSCPSGSRSPGPTAFARSCSPMCRATGSSARRTRSIRCISNGCTTTGVSACAAAPMRRQNISRSS